MPSIAIKIPIFLFQLFIISSNFVLFTDGQNQVTLEAIKADGPIPDPGSVRETTNVQLKCLFAIPQVNYGVTVRLNVKNITDGLWIRQVACARSGPDFIGYDDHQDRTPKILFNTSSSCKAGEFYSNITMTANSPQLFQCDVEVNGGYEEVAEIELRTHTTPTTPVISAYPDTAVKEGVDMNFTCQSTARPPPKLRFTLGEGDLEVPSAETTHTPSLDSITADNSSETSILTWTTKAVEQMDGLYLRCSSIDHPSKTQSGADTLLTVYYGPRSTGNETVDWNIEDGNKALQCQFEGKGNINYNWYNRSVTADQLLHDKQVYTLYKKDFSYLAGGESVKVSLICMGTNTQNDDKQDMVHFYVNVQYGPFTTTSISTTSTAEDKPTKASPGNLGGSSGKELPPYAIGLIIAGAVLLVIVVLVIIALVYKNRQSPAALKKKQAADNNSGGGYMNHSSRSSQPDVIRNSYIAPDVPSSPVTPVNPPYENRYSHHVEDYADAIDDMPRSRKPVAYNMDDLNDSFDGPPSNTMMGGPPGYQSSLYRDYPPQQDYSGYGAAC